jgi:hypothetical protein
VFTITYQIPGNCPICGHDLIITRLTCSHCSTKLEGEFVSCNFCRLDKEQWRFLEVFIRCRGNMRDMEKEFGLSYPTLRNRLEALIQLLGLDNEKSKPDTRKISSRMEVLNALEKGEIDPREAARLLREMEK